MNLLTKQNSRYWISVFVVVFVATVSFNGSVRFIRCHITLLKKRK